MNLSEAVKTVSEKFEYVSDTGSFLKDRWTVMSERDGKYRGDCEDFSLTIMSMVSGGVLSLLWNLFIGKYSLHFVASGASQSGDHCVGRIGDMWFDNWSLCEMGRDQFFDKTQHRYIKQFSFFIIASKLFTGFLFGKK